MKNQSPLHYVVKINSKEILSILISNGANINVKDINWEIIKFSFLLKYYKINKGNKIMKMNLHFIMQ